MDSKTPGPNYFTCTLGHAALWWKERRDDPSQLPPFETVNDLIDQQAALYPEAAALGFANPTIASITEACDRPKVQITFFELKSMSLAAAAVLSQVLDHQPEPTFGTRAVIGLLCTSGFEFVLTWLALNRLGYSVFLLAKRSSNRRVHIPRPQLEPEAVKHLCATCNLKAIFVDKRHQNRIASLGDEVSVLEIPDYNKDDSKNAIPSPTITTSRRKCIPSDIVVFFHTSGTSTGLPSAVPLTHHGAVKVLPRLHPRGQRGTFSTTPLYHGGLVDCFRSWTSGCPVWFFPEGSMPMTANTILQSLDFAHQESSTSVGYFSSVPHVLQMLAEEADGVAMLQSMDLVGVGGAALAGSVGDRLVQAGVKLLSRMGSAECGFLMSSDREFADDQEWQYLRPVEDSESLAFESSRDDGLFELIVRPGWPLRVANPNRDDGSYATADLFQPHPSIANAWRYHSRADAQIALANGKKFDPSPLENAILSGASADVKFLRDVLVIGAGRDSAAALLFVSQEACHGVPEKDIVEIVWPSVERVNRINQSHARLAKPMLVIVRVEDNNAKLPKSSKGSILRRQAEERYQDTIEAIYLRQDGVGFSLDASEDEVAAAVRDIFAQVLDREIDADMDLYHQGVDSISAIQVRRLIERTMLPSQTPALPLNIVYDCGTIAGLASHVNSICRGDKVAETSENDNASLQLMEDLVKKFGAFGTMAKPNALGQVEEKRINKPMGEVVVLTGATGFLGAHVLHSLLQKPQAEIHKVYCLVRAPTQSAAHGRVAQGLSSRGLEVQDHSSIAVCLPCNLAEADLGLSAQYMTDLIHEASIIIHAAWTVNFNLPLSSFENDLRGTHNLLDLAQTSSNHASFHFISSTAAVTSSRLEIIPEMMSTNPSDASPLGYGKSKWVAEGIVRQAAAAARESRLPQALSIIRVGQLCGNKFGVWSASEAYPLMLSTARLTGCLPNLPSGTAASWLPVEYAAEAVLEIALSPKRPKNGGDVGLGVYHVVASPKLSPSPAPSWREMLEWIQEDIINHSGTPSGSSNHTKDELRPFDIVPPIEWVHRLRARLSELEEQDIDKASGRDGGHPSQALLGLWTAEYGARRPRTAEEEDGERVGEDESRGTSGGMPRFDVSRASKVSRIIRELEPLGQDMVLKMWRWISREEWSLKGHLREVYPKMGASDVD
ncbi:hypothetical protein V8F33_009896 [Rhypophila sp. PSN 637]